MVVMVIGGDGDGDGDWWCRYSSILMSEKAGREEAEVREMELRTQLSSLSDKCASLEKALAKERAVFRADREGWAQEKREMQRECEEDLSRGLAERDQLVTGAQEEVKRRIAEMTLRFNRTVQDLEVGPSRWRWH
jgi:hypothetical protein